MSNTFKSVIENRKENSRIVNQIYLNETIIDKSAMAFIFIDIKFKNCTFEKLNFATAAFSQCEFYECHFMKSNFHESEISETNFDLCQFNQDYFPQAYLEDCNFNNTKFQNLERKGPSGFLDNSRISMSSWSINFNGSFNFDKVVEFLNSIDIDVSDKINHYFLFHSASFRRSSLILDSDYQTRSI